MILLALLPWLTVNPWGFDPFDRPRIALAALVVFLLRLTLTHRPRTDVDRAGLWFLAVCGLSACFAWDRTAAVLGYEQQGFYGLVALVTYGSLWGLAVAWGPGERVNYLRVSTAAGALVCLYAVAQRLGYDVPHPWGAYVGRAHGTLGSPVWLSEMLGITTPLVVAYAWLRMTSKSKPWLGWCLITVWAFGLAAAGSWCGYLAAIVGLGVYRYAA